MKHVSNPRNFLFDLYGTLVDIHTDEESAAFWNAVAALFELGDAQTIRARYLALCHAEKLPEGGEFDLLKVFERLDEEFGGKREPEAIARAFRAASMKKLRLFHGAKEILRGLRERGAGVYLLSNAQACFTRYELEQLGILELFDGIILSSEVGWKKPCAKFFEAALEMFSLSPASCVYIGNDLHDDIAGSHSVHMRNVYLPTEQSGKYAENIVPDLAVKDHGELEKVLFEMTGEIV
ncbi:MAG: HAD family hydrolase [Clostridiales bacterium]|nr:HAD family hydrolase [Clostridiales bacterium]